MKTKKSEFGSYTAEDMRLKNRKYKKYQKAYYKKRYALHKDAILAQQRARYHRNKNKKKK